LINEEKPSPKSLEEYLSKGGFPEFVRYGKSGILRELLYDVLYRDIASRHNLRRNQAVTGNGTLSSFERWKRVFI